MTVRVKMKKGSASEAGALVAGREYPLEDARALELVKAGSATLVGITLEELEQRVATGVPVETTEGAGPAETADVIPSEDTAGEGPAETGEKPGKKKKH